MRIDATLEALSAVKNLTLAELTALLEAIAEKAKSSTDFSHLEKTDYFFSFLDDVICDSKYYQIQRDIAVQHDVINGVFDRKFGFVRGMEA